MNKKVIIGIGIVGAILLSGCAGSQPEKAGSGINYASVEGKTFAVPKGSLYEKRTLSAKEAKELQKYGFPCKKGNIRWMFKKYNDSIRSGSDVTNGFRQGYIGCVAPMTNQQIQAVQNQQQVARQANTARQTSSRQASQVSPQLYNPNYTYKPNEFT